MASPLSCFGHGPGLGGPPPPFTDLYAVLGAEAHPDMPQDELRSLYESRRKEHGSPSNAAAAGPPVSKSLLEEAWEVLRDEERRKAYGTVWLRNKQAFALPAQERADVFRRKGNELYSAAKEMTRGGGMNLSAVQEGLKLYRAAMQQYTTAAALTPNDHRLFSNRAICYLAVEDLPRCREDAQRCTELRPDFAKGWYILAQVLWQKGRHEEALQELEKGLAAVVHNKELLELRADLAGGGGVSSGLVEGGGFAGGRGAAPIGRSVSPSATPGPSRQPSPSPGSGMVRPSSPLLVAAGGLAAGGSYLAGRPSPSRSPGAASRLPCPPARHGPCPVELDASGTCLTGNFGVPTPCFASSPPERPLPPVLVRGSYSPGPSGHHGSTSARSAGATHTGFGFTSASPGSRPGSRPRSSSQGPGPDLGATFDIQKASLRRSPSLRKCASPGPALR